MNKTAQKFYIWAITALMAFGFSVAGCATAPDPITLPTGEGPQLVVSPQIISLGVATLVDTTIKFHGSGFDPEDSVFITIQEKGKPEAPVIAIADSAIDADGGFSTEVAKLVKITDLLHADVGIDEDMETYIILSKAPVAAADYVATAQSMESDKTAACSLTIKNPSLTDSLKDWIGTTFLGKIEKR